MTKKLIIFLIIILVVLGFIVYGVFINKEEPQYTLAEATMSEVTQEVAETGAVRVGKEINLRFESGGQIKNIYTSVGDIAEAGQALIGLNTSQLYIQISEAQAALRLARAQFDQLLAGASDEEIKVTETAVANAEVSLKNAQQSLQDVVLKAEEDLANTYADALNVLDDSQIRVANAYNLLDQLQKTYFTSGDTESSAVKTATANAKRASSDLDASVQIAKTSSQDENISTALTEAKNSLTVCNQSLAIARESAQSAVYRDVVSSTDKASIETKRSDVNTSLTSIVNTQQTISSAKIANTTNINSSQSKVESAEGTLETAKDELALTKAPPRQVDIDYYQAKVDQAQANVSLLQDQINDATLKAPVRGQVTDIKKEAGETVQATENIISFLPASPFQVEVDIYEEDIVKIKKDDPAEIILAALPNTIFNGKVIFIDPAEKLVDGVVYYKVTIDFHEVKEGIKPGMSADVVIKTEIKQDVLVVPEKAVEKKNGDTFVEISINGKTERRKVETGLWGDNEFVEIISGVQEKEQVVIPD